MPESCISQTLLLAETILVDTPVVDQDYMHVWILIGGGGVEGTSMAMQHWRQILVQIVLFGRI